MNISKYTNLLSCLLLAFGLVACGDDNSASAKDDESSSSVTQSSADDDDSSSSAKVSSSSKQKSSSSSSVILSSSSEGSSSSAKSSSSVASSSSAKSSSSSSSTTENQEGSSSSSKDSKYAFEWNTLSEWLTCVCDETRDGWVGIALYRSDKSEFVCEYDEDSKNGHGPESMFLRLVLPVLPRAAAPVPSLPPVANMSPLIIQPL